MSGPEAPPPVPETDPGTGEGRGADPPRRRARTALVAGVVAVAVAATAAVATTTAVRRSQAVDGTAVPAVAGGAGPPATARPSRRIVHEFTTSYTGPVWVTVETGAGAGRELELTWGPWRRLIRQVEAGPVTYWFEKKDPDSVPLSIEVPGGATARFGEGPVPEGAVDVRPGWSRRPPSAVDEPLPGTSSTTAAAPGPVPR
jgi:hypothetical protein